VARRTGLQVQHWLAAITWDRALAAHLEQQLAADGEAPGLDLAGGLTGGIDA
jgi:hypothetical protein